MSKNYNMSKDLWYETAKVCAFCVAGIILLALLLGDGQDEAIATYSGFFEGSLGIAVAMAGAVVAIRIAHIANHTVQKEAIREQVTLAKETLSGICTLYHRLGEGVERMFTASVMIQQYIGANSESFAGGKGDQAGFSELDRLKRHYIIGLDEIIEAISSIKRNPLALATWNACKPKEPFFKNASDLEPATLTQLLHIFRDRLAERSADDLITLVAMANSYETNDASVRTAFFCGSLIESETFRDQSVYGLKNDGLRLLCDLTSGLPESCEEIIDRIEEDYDEQLLEPEKWNKLSDSKAISKGFWMSNYIIKGFGCIAKGNNFDSRLSLPK
jgi:hypothetical protein